MFIQVKLLNGFKNQLTYKVPEDWIKNSNLNNLDNFNYLANLVGKIVNVPLRKKIEIAYIERVFTTLDKDITYNIREAKSLENLPNDTFYKKFTQKLSSYYSVDQIHFFKKIKYFLEQTEDSSFSDLKIINQKYKNKEKKKELNINKLELTQEQKDIANSIVPEIKKSNYFPSLIHGVTGSGKTEIYKKLINSAISQNKSTILLLPEVTLAVQFFNLLKSQLSNTSIYGFHSATSVKEKKELWSSLLNNIPIVIIGVHLPTFLPISNLGLIIIDEEHETGFQEKKHPKISTKEAALLRAQLYNVPIILGSATPSISSLYNVKNRNWKKFELKKRFSGDFPKIKLVKLNNKQKRYNFWITKELEFAIKQRLERKEQIIIFLNRRGYSFFIQCKKCGFTPQCQNCSVSLTLHKKLYKKKNKDQDQNQENHEIQELKCHYCSYKLDQFNQLNICLNCKSSAKYLIKKGVGTQQIVKILSTIFPNATIERADLDSTINKKKWQETVKDFEDEKIDILVGTQTITKGYHFPKVTLVGILWADINLSLPIYNSSEVTLQQIIQVAGRAGRQSPESEVIVQTILDHPIYQYLNEVDYTKFYEYEIENRKDISYPPVSRFAEIEIKNCSSSNLDKESEDIFENLFNYSSLNKLDIKILGPADPPINKIKNFYLKKIYLKSSNINSIIKLYESINKAKYSSYLFFTPNPLS